MDAVLVLFGPLMREQGQRGFLPFTIALDRLFSTMVYLQIQYLTYNSVASLCLIGEKPWCRLDVFLNSVFECRTAERVSLKLHQADLFWVFKLCQCLC